MDFVETGNGSPSATTMLNRLGRQFKPPDLKDFPDSAPADRLTRTTWILSFSMVRRFSTLPNLAAFPWPLGRNANRFVNRLLCFDHSCYPYSEG